MRKNTQKHTRDNLSRERWENAECKTWLALFTVPKLITNLQLWEFTTINMQGAEISKALSLSSLLPRSSHQSAIWWRTKHLAALSLDLNNCSQSNLALPGEPFNCQSPLARMKRSGDHYLCSEEPWSPHCWLLAAWAANTAGSQLSPGVMVQIRSGCHGAVIPVQSRLCFPSLLLPNESLV